MALSRDELAARYGTALFDYAQDMNVIDSVAEELNELKKAVKTTPSILNMLSDPIMNTKEKEAALAEISKVFSKEVQSFLNLLLEYNRFEYLVDIIDYYDHLYDQKKSIASGVATTAVKLDDDQLKRLSESFAKKYDLNEVRLENQVDPSILGGVILEVQDLVIDGSVKNRLKKIRAQLVDED